MREVCCNFCGRDDYEVVNQGPDLLLNRPGNFRLVRCRRCGLIYQNPQLTLEELSDHYPDEYEPYQRGVVGQLSTWQQLDRNHEMARRCTRVTAYKPEGGRLLDVGCSTGLFLAAMRGRSWQVAGVELSAYAAAYARRTHNLDVFTGTLAAAGLPENSFDVVTLWDVFEHVVDPKATLAEIGRILKPGGIFVASLPNPTCLEAKLFKDKWVGWDRPRHLNLFTPDVIAAYLRDANFELDKIESFGGRLALSLMSLDFVVTARGGSQEKWQKWRKLIYTPPIRLATWPLYRLAGAFNQLSIMTVFARLRK